MKRLLIFTILFPPLALVVFNAPDVIGHRDFRLLNFDTLQMTYAIAVIPALLLAALDWKLSAQPNPVRIAGTTATAALTAMACHTFPGGRR